MRFLFRNEYFWLGLMVTGMIAIAAFTIIDRLPFSKFWAKEISAEEFRDRFNFDKSDYYEYVGSDDRYHYLHHNGDTLQHWLKIRKSALILEPHTFGLDEKKRTKLTGDVLDDLVLAGE